MPSWQRNFTSLRFSDIRLNNLIETKRLPSGGRFAFLQEYDQGRNIEAEMDHSIWLEDV
jgi:hypothetical protein